MQALSAAIEAFRTSQLLPLGITIIVIALTIVGFAFIIGTRQMIDWAKNHIFHIIGGAALIYLAANIGQALVSNLGGPAGF